MRTTIQKTLWGTGICCALSIAGAQQGGAVSPYTNDVHTVLLDHFDGSTAASILAFENNGAACGPTRPPATPNYGFGAGPNGLNQAMALYAPSGTPVGSGSYLKYPGGELLCQTNGTMECWIYLTSYAFSFHQYNYVGECEGDVGGIGVDSTGQLGASLWYTIFSPFSLDSGTNRIPLSTWTHVALSWGSAGAKLFINGVLVGTNANTGSFADWFGLDSVFVNLGSGNQVDELRISNVQRTEFSVQPGPGAGPPAWQSVTIPGLPIGSQLDQVWARTREEAYVWASRNTGGSWDSWLYRWNGMQWNKVLDAPGSYGVSVHGTGASEVFAAATTTIWRSVDNGQSWVPQSLPTLAGDLRKLTGTTGNIHANAEGGQIIRFNGTAWSAVFSDSGNPPYTLDVGAAGEGYFITCWGWGGWNGNQWTFNGQQFDFCDIYDTWWTRDTHGALHWYAVGNENFANGVRVWKFDTSTASFGCKSCYVFSDGSAQYIGSGYGIWGSASDDVYVIGDLADYSNGPRSGRVYHYDGSSWSQVTSIGTIPHPGGVAGTAADDVWVSLGTAGTMLHYAPVVPPTLQIFSVGANVLISWPGAAVGYRLQASGSLSTPISWTSVTNIPTVHDNRYEVTLPKTSGVHLFRLITP